jgi:polar amino acid transport system permease protein
VTNLHAPSTTPAVASAAQNRWARFDRWWLLFFAVLFLVVALVLLAPKPYGDIWNFVKDGIIVTLKISIVSFFFILIVGVLGGMARVSHNRFLNLLSSLYVEVVRGIPVLVWLLWIWYALPQVRDSVGTAVASAMPTLGNAILGVKFPPFTAAVIGFTVAYGAYMTEIFRAGIQSIPRGQMEAARSLGMSYFQSMRHIILPQAFRVILPPLGNEFVTLLKDSSLVSVLAVSDLTRRGREYVARSFLSFDTFTLIALLYLVLTLFFTRVFTAVERQMAVDKR